MQVNVWHKDERRPRPRKRRSDDSRETVKQILARHMPAITVAVVGCLCVYLPISFGIAGQDFWPIVIAYGGCLLGCALGGVVR